MIPGERAPRCISAMQTRRKPHDKKPGPQRTKRRYWPAGILGMADPNRAQKPGETRAPLAAGVVIALGQGAPRLVDVFLAWHETAGSVVALCANH